MLKLHNLRSKVRRLYRARKCCDWYPLYFPHLPDSGGLGLVGVSAAVSAVGVAVRCVGVALHDAGAAAAEAAAGCGQAAAGRGPGPSAGAAGTHLGGAGRPGPALHSAAGADKGEVLTHLFVPARSEGIMGVGYVY